MRIGFSTRPSPYRPRTRLVRMPRLLLAWTIALSGLTATCGTLVALTFPQFPVWWAEAVIALSVVTVTACLGYAVLWLASSMAR